jgi:ATP-dependent Clp protease adaptor protein ClpS
VDRSRVSNGRALNGLKQFSAAGAPQTQVHDMADIDIKPRAKVIPKVARPPLHKVILVNDDFTPRDFVVMVLKAEFRMPEAQALKVMLTAHQKGSCVVAVFTREVAESKSTQATEMARAKGYPLLFTTEPEE